MGADASIANLQLDYELLFRIMNVLEKEGRLEVTG